MTFHEKSRWIALLANLAVWGWYFITIARALAAGAPDARGLIALAIPVTIVITIIHIVAHAAVAIAKPSEARTDLDERERAIARRATAAAYHVLSVGIVMALAASLYYWTAFVAVNAVLLAFIVAESVRYLIEIVSYRRGWHG
jgi:hypothetical protein